MYNKKFSFLILCSFFILGIVSNIYVIRFITFIKIFIILLIPLIITIKLKKLKIGTILIYVEIFIIGTIYIKLDNAKKKYNHILRGSEEYICTSQKTKELKNKYTSIDFIALKVKKNNVWYDINDIIHVNLIIRNDENKDFTIMYGDSFIIKGSPELICKTKNTKSYIFYKYYTSNGTYYNHFINLGNMKYIGSKPIFYMKYILEKTRYILKTSTLKNITSEDSKSILSNLLFGKGDYIEKNLKESYTKSGIIHILAISGLHIGLIFLIFTFILSLFIKNKTTTSVISLILSWIYGFIISMPVSVLRTLIMISFYKISNIYNRNNFKYSFIFNSLIISLIINPSWIYSVGFQLSYLATFAILFIQRDINIFLKTKLHIPLNYLQNSTNEKFMVKIIKWVIKYILDSISVFIAVNILISPILLYNFHYINLFSIVSNIVILPFLPLIISLGIILILFCWTTYINLLISNILSPTISFLNFIITKLSNVEFFIIYIDEINIKYIIVYYIFIISIILFLKNKNTNIMNLE